MAKSIQNKFVSGLCKISTHQWGQWVLNDNSCTSTRKCKRCGGAETQQVNHVWGEWTLAKTKCIQIRTCSHCGKEEINKVKHTWGEWKFVENNCVQFRVCTRCGQREETKVEHIWHARRNNKCIETRICGRCSKEEPGKIKHAWGNWKNTEEYNCGNNKKVRECEQCHELEISEPFLDHTWGDWEFISEECATERTCRFCGKKETISHDYELINETYLDSKKVGAGDDYDYYYEQEYRCKRCGKIKIGTGIK